MARVNRDEYNEYMREYMRLYRIKETYTQRTHRLEWNRNYSRRRYAESLARLGLPFIGSGHRRDWEF